MHTAHVIPRVGTLSTPQQDLPVLSVEWAYAGKSRYFWCEKLPIRKDGGLTAAGQRIIERIRENGLPNPVDQSDRWIAEVSADETTDDTLIVTLCDDVGWSDEIMERIRNAYCGFPGDAQFVG